MPLLPQPSYRLDAPPPAAPSTKRGPVNTDPLLTAKEAADYRRQGVSTFWRHVKMGLVPAPIYITDRSPRWRLSDLCPSRQSATPQS
jgi:predicted DNA-binding transcriptional regulator AlpA